MLPARFNYLYNATPPAWLAKAIAELGVAEVAGRQSNPKILDYRKLGMTPMGGDDGEVPWCAIFVNAMLERSMVPGSRSAMARSFSRHSAFAKLLKPMLGAIAVKASNRGPASGHVGFYVGEEGDRIWLLGGNQNDEVNFSSFRRAEFVGFYWPKGQPWPKRPFDQPIAVAAGGKAAPVRES